MSNLETKSKIKLTTKEIVIFGMLGGVMYASKEIMAALPNIHLLGAFIVSLTVVYRKKALYPIYVFVFLAGLLNGFNTWWIPYLYIWLLLWGATMILPQNMNKKAAPFVYCIISALHGFLYGTFYAPFQAVCFGLGLKGMVAWIISGLPFDVMHGLGNLVCGVIIVPLIKIFTKMKEW